RPEARGGDGPGGSYIAGANLQDAMHGDRVVVRIERVRDDGRAEGKVIRVLERSASTVVGRYVVDPSGLGFVTPFDRKITTDIQVPPADTRGARSGEMVTVEITRFPTATRNPAGRIVEVLGDINAAGVDQQIIIRKYGIPEAHGDEAVTEARRIGGTVREKDLEGGTDFPRVPPANHDGG